MKDAILLFDGSSYSNMAAEHLAKITGKETDLALNVNEATGLIQDNTNRYAALFTEPMTYFTRTNMRAGYREFLASLRTMNIPVIIYSTQSENTSDKSWGIEEWELAKGQHYDGFVSKGHPDEKEHVTSILEQIAKKG